MDNKPHRTGLIIGIIVAIIVLAIGIGVGIWLYERNKKKHELVPITPSKQKYKGIWSKLIDSYSQQGQTQADAPAYCSNNNSQLASKTQMDGAYKANPFSFCRGGWMDDKNDSSGYYMKTLDQSCGNKLVGFNPFLPDASGKLGVYCYGYPPDDLNTGKDLWLPDQTPS